MVITTENTMTARINTDPFFTARYEAIKAPIMLPIERMIP